MTNLSRDPRTAGAVRAGKNRAGAGRTGTAAKTLLRELGGDEVVSRFFHTGQTGHLVALTRTRLLDIDTTGGTTRVRSLPRPLTVHTTGGRRNWHVKITSPEAAGAAVLLSGTNPGDLTALLHAATPDTTEASPDRRPDPPATAAAPAPATPGPRPTPKRTATGPGTTWKPSANSGGRDVSLNTGDLTRDPRTRTASFRPLGTTGAHARALLAALRPTEHVERYLQTASAKYMAVTADRILIVRGMWNPVVADVPRPFAIEGDTSRDAPWVLTLTAAPASPGRQRIQLTFLRADDVDWLREHAATRTHLYETSTAAAAVTSPPARPETPPAPLEDRLPDNAWAPAPTRTTAAAGAAARVSPPNGHWAYDDDVLGWRDAEELAAAHMRHLGFTDARRTGEGSDGGLDVISTRAVAQVKHHTAAIGRPALQRLVGAALRHPTRLFYSSNGYTPAALEYAADADVALFTFTDTGAVSPTNPAARTLTRALAPVQAPAPAASSGRVSRWLAERERAKEAELTRQADQTRARIQTVQRQINGQRRRLPSSRTKKMARAEASAEARLAKATKDLAKAADSNRSHGDRRRYQRNADAHVDKAAADLGIRFL